MATLKARIVDKDGRVTGYVLGNGRRVSISQLVKMAERGQIPGVVAAHWRRRRDYIRSLPDGRARNNLSELPDIRE
jgi:hypothetical protein